MVRKALLRIEEIQDIARDCAELVIDGTEPGMAFVGGGGLGKTFTINSVLRAHQIVPAEYALNAHVTPLGLYQTLYELRNEKAVILDDMEHIYRDAVSVSLLRAALWGEHDNAHARMKRVVHYKTSKDLNIPKNFEFKGGIFLLGNRIPKETDPVVDALLSRIQRVDLIVDSADVFAFMRKLASRGYTIYDGKRQAGRKVSRKDCEQVIAYLEDKQITDLRFLRKALAHFIRFKGQRARWKRNVDHMARSRAGTLSRHTVNPRQVFLELVRDNERPENEKAQLFSERTRGYRGRENGLSRATYFRWKKEYFEQVN